VVRLSGIIISLVSVSWPDPEKVKQVNKMNGIVRVNSRKNLFLNKLTAINVVFNAFGYKNNQRIPGSRGIEVQKY